MFSYLCLVEEQFGKWPIETDPCGQLAYQLLEHELIKKSFEKWDFIWFWPFVLAYVIVSQLAFSVSVIQPLSDGNYKLMKIYNKDFTLIIDIHFYEKFSTPNSNP
jgi:hypothetical protein